METNGCLWATGLGFRITPDQLTIAFGGATLDTLELLSAARAVHRAIRAVVDPIAVEVHYLPPLVDVAPSGPTAVKARLPPRA